MSIYEKKKMSEIRVLKYIEVVIIFSTRRSSDNDRHNDNDFFTITLVLRAL